MLKTLYCSGRQWLLVILLSAVQLNAVSADSYEKIIQEKKLQMEQTLKGHYPNELIKLSDSKGESLTMSIKDKIELSGPYQWRPKKCQHGEDKKGFLMVHTVFLDAHSLKEVAKSLQTKYPCSVIKGVLLRGHGTHPSELALNDEGKPKVTKEDWVGDVTDALKTFKVDGIEKVYVVAHSIGGTVAYRVAQEKTDAIDGLILFNPAIEGNLKGLVKKAALSALNVIPYKKEFKFQQPIRYLSLPTSVYKQADDLFSEVLGHKNKETQAIVKVPSLQFHVVGDTSIDIKANCDKHAEIESPYDDKHTFILYHGENSGLTIPKECDKNNIEKIELGDSTIQLSDGRTTTQQALSHVALIHPYHDEPLDEDRYFSTEYYHCSSKFHELTRQQCVDKLSEITLTYKSDKKNKNLSNLDSVVNPHFPQMMERVYQFIDALESDN